MEIKFPPSTPPSEFSQTFVQGMADRMSMSYAKYGRVAEGFPHRVNAIATLKEKLALYERTGNTEWLMDAANYAMIEFMHPRHPKAHFKPTDSRESTGRVWVGEKNPVKDNNRLETA